MANETLAIYFWQNCGTEVHIIEIQESSSSRDGDIITFRSFPRVPLGWLVLPALRLALRYICVRSHAPSFTRCPRDGTPVLRVELRGPAAKVGWVIFCSARLLDCVQHIISCHTIQPVACTIKAYKNTQLANFHEILHLTAEVSFKCHF